MRDFIKTINRERGATVILTTHDMQDIEALTERILLIGKGRILLDGSLEELKKRNSTHKTLTVDYTGRLDGLSDGMSVSKNLGGHAVIVVDTTKIPVSAAIAKISEQAEIADLSVAGATAEEMVVALYKEFRI